MTALKICIYPDPILYKKAEQVPCVDDSICVLIKDMAETMHSSKGIGLAANQVGIPKRIIIVMDNQNLVEIINPEIERTTGEETAEEGCISLPGEAWKIKRAKKITVHGINVRGRKIKIKAEGLLARIIQHEIDHLNGILIKDRASFGQTQPCVKSYENKL
ncbi:peptide deformylase [bacterium Unc6]|nr:peptide deformylase [bacterium Unc6]